MTRYRTVYREQGASDIVGRRSHTLGESVGVGQPRTSEVFVNKTPALLAFLAVCVVLAVLLLAGVVTPIAASLLFAVALLVFGSASRAFQRDKRDHTKTR